MTKNQRSSASPREHREDPPGDHRPRELATALRDADWDKILPQLVDYADKRLRRLGWAKGANTLPSAAEATQLVDEAIVRSLAGDRRWNEDDPPELVAFLCGVIRSISSDEKKAVTKMGPMESFDSPHIESELKHAVPTPEELVREGAWNDKRLGHLRAAIEGDEDLQLLYMAIVEEGCERRDEIAECLGWDPDKVSVLRKKLNRRLTQSAGDGKGEQ